MDVTSFLVATAIAHVGFAICVTAHAALTGRDVGAWPYLTLAFGLAGVAGYLFYDRDGPI